jgi:CubicO group peptidase (beta-lactamase class C family)
LPEDRQDLEERVAYTYQVEKDAPGYQFSFGFDIENPPVIEWKFVWNRPEVHRMVLPSGGGISTARDFARFYGMLANDGIIDDVRILQPATIHRAIQRTNTPGEIDRHMMLPVPWSLGFVLGGEHRVPAYGETSTHRTFGHGGAGCTVGWADLDYQLGFCYLTNGNLRFVNSFPRTGELSDLVRGSCL